MITILLHSSKTMKALSVEKDDSLDAPALLDKAKEINAYLKTLSLDELQSGMKTSEAVAKKTHALIEQWNGDAPRRAAIDSFLGDIYSGLQAQSFTKEDRRYAHEHLFIFSGLYGVLRACDGIQPYRLEMAYRFPKLKSLYDFWGDAIARQLPKTPFIVNLSAVEYTKAVFPHLTRLYADTPSTIVSPKFLTISPKTGQPTFVTVHAKIARGAFAHWLVKERITSQADLKNFTALGYVYSKELSTPLEPVFIAQEFKGIGLSIRLA